MRPVVPSPRRRWPLPAWLGVLLAVYLVAPTAWFVVTLLDGAAARSPGGPAGPGLWPALGVSILTATIAAAIAAVIGIPLAYLLARSRSRALGVVGVLVQLPIGLPPLMSGLLLLAVVGPYTTIGKLFGGRLTDDLAGIVLAQVFVAAPFLIVAARSAFAAIDPALEDVAATLGRRPADRLLRIVVPAAGRGIAAGLVLTWLRAFGEFGATVVLAYHPYSLPIYTFVQFGSAGLHATVAPLLATLVTGVAVTAAAAAALRVRRRHTAVLPAPRRPDPGARPTASELRFQVAGHAGSFTVRAAAPAVRHLAVLGPSGAGKTLLLRLLAGVAAADAGHLALDGKDLWATAMERRRIGYLPQDDALVPGRPVWRQVMLGRDADPAVAAWWLRRLGLEGLADRRPEELSGGQRRRVALARALAIEPRLLLLDEPFSGLDAVVRDDLRRELRKLQQEAGFATVLVTHDPDDAALLADRILVLQAGQVLADGPIGALRRDPPSANVARLVGLSNVFHGQVAGPGSLRCGDVEVPAADHGLPVDAPVMWHVPASAVRLGDGDVRGRVVDVVDWGAAAQAVVRIAPAAEVAVTLAQPSTVPIGQSVALTWDPEAARVWPADAESARQLARPRQA